MKVFKKLVTLILFALAQFLTVAVAFVKQPAVIIGSLRKNNYIVLSYLWKGGELMKPWVWVIFFCLFLLFFVSAEVKRMQKRHREATGDTVNYDPMMRKYIYKVRMPREEILCTLGEEVGGYELSCEIDTDSAVICFISAQGDKKRYYYDIEACEGHCILRLEAVAPIGSKSNIPCQLNPFMVEKLHAEPLPFAQYEKQGK